MMQSHGSQILPSPARLGLTSNHSPSLPPNPSTPNPTPAPSTNPNPNPKPSPSTSIPAPTTTSASLLPLLPPLPRAQSLLLQMSVLATKLFELSSARSFWLASYRGSFPTFPPSSNSPPSPLPSTIKDVLSLFTSLQTQLFESVAELQEILDLQDSKGKLSREIGSKDTTLLSFTKKLREAHQVLDGLTEDYSDYLTHCRSSLDLQDVLSYAHRISYTTFAPPEHGANLAPLRGALPPAPQENEMRASQLYQFANLDVGVPPRKPSETKEQEEQTVVDLQADETRATNRVEGKQRVDGGTGAPAWPTPPPQRAAAALQPETIQVAAVSLDIYTGEETSDDSSETGTSEDDDED